MEGKTVEQLYQKKTQLEHILIRPDTYIGSVNREARELFVWSGQTQRDLSATDAPPSETLKYLFRYYAAVGVAAEYSNDPQPPFFELS